VDGELGAAAGRLLSSAGDVEAALAAIEDMAALARRPGAQVDAVTHYLCRFIQAWHELSPDPSKRVTPDAQAALTLLGSLPRDVRSYIRLEGMAIAGANLAGLDFRGAAFDRVELTELEATGVNLTSAWFRDVTLTDAVLDGACLDHADIIFAALRGVSLRRVSRHAAYIAGYRGEDVTATYADGTGFSISPPTEWVTVIPEPVIPGPAQAASWLNPPTMPIPVVGEVEIPGPGNPGGDAVPETVPETVPPPWEPVICGPGGEAEADTVLSGRYRLDQLVGRGTMATVWRARDLLLDREVAVKWLLNWDYGRLSHQLFGREAQIMAKLRHPGIVAIYDTGMDGGWPYIVMELLFGGDLSQLMSFYRQGLPVHRAVDLAIQLADAVVAIHERGIVHCSLSTQNVFVQEGDQVKVIDFAIAQDRSAEPAPPPDGYVMGVPEYMAPELFDSQDPAYTVSSDLYGLGCVLYEMLTGAPPFTSDSGFPGYIRQHIEETPAPPRDHDPAITEALNDLVLALLLKAPADRPGSAADVAAALRDIQASLPGPGALHLA
jgi:tRNA A-37 threonylcarbamoyl transferase component Bud32